MDHFLIRPNEKVCPVCVDTLTQRWSNAGPASSTLIQQQPALSQRILIMIELEILKRWLDQIKGKMAIDTMHRQVNAVLKPALHV